MAMQIMSAKVTDKTITYFENAKQINVTNALKPICDRFFQEETLLEEDENITVQVARICVMPELSEYLANEILSSVEKLNETKGNEAKSEIASNIKDYVLFRSIIISMLMTDDAQNSVLLIC